MGIHKEGRSLLLVLLILFGVVSYFTSIYLSGIWTILIYAGLWIFYLLVLQFFRNPVIKITEGDKLVLAPADGKVVVVEEVLEDEYLKENRKQISIFMSPLNVHVNRSPVSGLVSYYKYHKGKYLVAWHPKSSTENERTTLVVKSEDGTEVLFRQIAGAVARRIKCYVDKGDTLFTGQEFGFIKFGSRVDIFLPLDAEVKVKPGDISKGGRTVIAVLK